MRKLIVLIGAGVLFLSIYKFGIFGLFLCVGMVCLGLSIEAKRERIEKLKRYSKRFESIYVVSNHPTTDEQITIESLKDYIINVPYESVLERCEEEREWLHDSENEFYNNFSIPKPQRLTVVPIIFQDAKVINETWDLFAERVRYEIETDRQLKHSSLKSADSDWYDQHGNNQNVFEWDVKKKLK